MPGSTVAISQPWLGDKPGDNNRNIEKAWVPW